MDYVNEWLAICVRDILKDARKNLLLKKNKFIDFLQILARDLHAEPCGVQGQDAQDCQEAERQVKCETFKFFSARF